MSDAHACETCGKPAATDDTFCGQCGGRLTAHPSPPAPSGLRARLATLSFRRGSIALAVLAAVLILLAWLDGARAVPESLQFGLVALLVLTVIGTLSLAYSRPIAPGWAAALVGVIYAIPVVCLHPDMVRRDLAEARPVFLVAGVINVALVVLLCALRRRRTRRPE